MVGATWHTRSNNSQDNKKVILYGKEDQAGSSHQLISQDEQYHCIFYFKMYSSIISKKLWLHWRHSNAIFRNLWLHCNQESVAQLQSFQPLALEDFTEREKCSCVLIVIQIKKLSYGTFPIDPTCLNLCFQ